MSVFKQLFAINVNDKTDKKDKLTYLSWAWAWAEVKKLHEDANYEVVKYDGKPYLFDENLGYLIETRVTIKGETIGMQLPVMNSINKAQKHVVYNYQVKEYSNGKFTGKMIDKPVEPATMFDVNTTIMRCLTKNLAMFGLGLYIYAGEDLPEENKEEKELLKAKELKDRLIKSIKDAETKEKLEVLEVYAKKYDILDLYFEKFNTL